MQFLQFNIANMGDSNVTNYQKAVQGTGKNAIFNTLGESFGTPAKTTMSCLKAAAGSDPQRRQPQLVMPPEIGC